MFSSSSSGLSAGVLKQANITGISKFSQMSIFSELNNLQNISMWDEYSAICGITEQEVHTLQIDIEQMAQANNETYEEACTHLKQQYDGYL
jgi:hypothetical protein